MIVGAWSQADFFDFGDVLIFLRVSRAFVLFELELAQVGDAAHRRFGRCRDLDQVKTCLFGAPNGLIDGQDPNLLAFGVQDADFSCTNLAIGPRAGRGRWARDKRWSWNVRFSFLLLRSQIQGIAPNVKLSFAERMPVSSEHFGHR